jgi:hypothetical protein
MPASATCPACAGAIQPGWKACPHCGRALTDIPAPINYAALGPPPPTAPLANVQAAQQELAQLRIQLPGLRQQAELLQRQGTIREFEAARTAYYVAQAREGELSRQLGQASLPAPEPAPWWMQFQTGYWGRLGPILLLGLAVLLMILFGGH